MPKSRSRNARKPRKKPHHDEIAIRVCDATLFAPIQVFALRQRRNRTTFVARPSGGPGLSPLKALII